MGGAITADGERTDEEREGDPPHPPEVSFNFSAVFATADRAVVFSEPFCPVDAVLLFTVFIVLYLC